MARLRSICAVGVMLAGCATLPESVLPPSNADTCDARQYAAVIGQDVTALEKVLILRQVRVIRPDTVITKDYRPKRINFHVTAGNLISRIACG